MERQPNAFVITKKRLDATYLKSEPKRGMYGAD